jgi:translation initiation factor IF-3
VDVVRVVDEKGEQMGVMPLAQAIQEAKKRGLDLVEVAPQANPVVCKFLDFGKYKYRQEKRERKKQKAQKLKEMRFTSQIEDHDFETKVRHIRRFLEHDDKVKVTVIFRGREIVHMDRGRELLGRLIKKTEGVGKVDQLPKIQGRSLQMVLVPTGMKENEHGQKEEESQGAGEAL